jgi:hypothetical protein
MLSTIVQNPESTFVAVLFVITAWPYFTRRWNDWRKEQFLRNHPSVILVSKPSQQDVWPTRLAKFVSRNAQNWIVFCCRVIVSILATILRTLTIWFTSKPTPAETTKPVVSLPPEPEPRETSPPTIRVNNAPTSVLKRRGERRRSMEPRVTFTESANGKVATSYYYYNPSQQSNQTAATMNAVQTPVVAQRAPRQSTPYPVAKQPPPTIPNNETPNAFSTLDKENLPKLSSYKNHSPGQRQMRAAMAPVTSALRKRRIELENIAAASDKKRRIPMGTQRSAVPVNPQKRRARQLLVWEHLNKKPKKEELKDETLNALPSSETTTQVTSTQNSASTSFAPPEENTVTSSQSNVLPNGATDKSTSTNGFQFGASVTSDSSQPLSSFQFGSTASAPTSNLAPSFPSQSTAQPKANTQSTPSLGFQFGASTAAESTASSTAPLESTASQSEKTSTNGFQFGSNGSSMNRKEEEPMSTNSSFQFGSSKPEAATNAAPTFAFGATTSAANATGGIPNSTSSSFGNSLQPPTSTASFQPAFQFGSSAENTPAPGPVVNGIVPTNVDSQTNQSDAPFQFGGSNATVSFGSNNAAPNATSAPAFGAPVFGMGSPAANNSARTRRLARRGRRVA